MDKNNDNLYSIGEVAKILDVTPPTLRYWEDEFQILSPKKSITGRRVYSDQDITILKLIYKLLKNDKYSISGAKLKIKEILNKQIDLDIEDSKSEEKQDKSNKRFLDFEEGSLFSQNFNFNSKKQYPKKVDDEIIENSEQTNNMILTDDNVNDNKKGINYDLLESMIKQLIIDERIKRKKDIASKLKMILKIYE